MRGLFLCLFLVATAVVAWAAPPTAGEVLASLPGPVNREEAAMLLKPLLRLEKQGMLNLVRFVDTTGAFQHKFVLDEMDREQLIKAHFGLHDLTSAQQEDILGMMNAAGYAEQLVGRFPITVEDMLEINARVVNSRSSSSSHLLTQQGRAWLEDYLSKFNLVMSYIKKQQDAVERGIGAFQIVAWSMDALREGRPFNDGNARVAEVMNAVVLTSVVGVPFPQRVQGHSFFTNALVDLGHGEQLVTNAIRALGSKSFIF